MRKVIVYTIIGMYGKAVDEIPKKKGCLYKTLCIADDIKSMLVNPNLYQRRQKI